MTYAVRFKGGDAWIGSPPLKNGGFCGNKMNSGTNFRSFAKNNFYEKVDNPPATTYNIESFTKKVRGVSTRKGKEKQEEEKL